MSQQDIIRVVFGTIENNCGLKITLEQPEIELPSTRSQALTQSFLKKIPNDKNKRSCMHM
jgi:hypothetical protein